MSEVDQTPENLITSEDVATALVDPALPAGLEHEAIVTDVNGDEVINAAGNKEKVVYEYAEDGAVTGWHKEEVQS